MNTEQIIKALECCSIENCNGCPYRGKCHQGNPMHIDALALIKEQQAEIEKLNLRLQTPLSPNQLNTDIYNKNLEAQIKEQEERIKELEAQDTERVKHIQTLNDCRIAAEEQAKKANAEIEELRAYNETLQRENKYLRERLAEEAEVKEDMAE